MAYDSLGRCTVFYLGSLEAFDEAFYQYDIPPGGTHLLDYSLLKVEGSKQTNGNIITALVDTALEEDSRWFEVESEAGDHACLEARLDTENLTLNCESALERDGEVVDRTVLEAVFLPEGTMLFQFLHKRYTFRDYHEYPDTREFAVFKRISGDSYSGIVAGAGLDFNFAYNSIIGRGDMTAAEMAQGYTGQGATHVFGVNDRHVNGDIIKGKVSYEKTGLA